MPPQIHLNYYREGRADITYEPIVQREDLEKSKPIFVTNEELEEIKNGVVEKVFDILNYNKF